MSSESLTGLEGPLPRWKQQVGAGLQTIVPLRMHLLLGTVSMSLWHRGHLPGQETHEITAENVMLFMIWPQKSHTLTSTCST